MAAPDHYLREVMSPGNVISEETREWLQCGLQAHMETADPLERCLGIERASYLRIQRDRHLVEAWRVIDESATPWGRCLLLEQQVARFETTVWRNHQDDDAPDPRWSQLWTSLFYAFHFSRGIRMVATAHRIREIVNSAGMYK